MLGDEPRAVLGDSVKGEHRNINDAIGGGVRLLQNADHFPNRWMNIGFLARSGKAVCCLECIADLQRRIGQVRYVISQHGLKFVLGEYSALRPFW